MDTNHDIFVEGNFVWENWEQSIRTISIQDAIKSMSYKQWVKPTLDKYGPAVKDLYLLLVYFPGRTNEQREVYIKEYKNHIVDALDCVDMGYMHNLHVTIGHNGSAVSYTPQDFLTTKESVQDTIQDIIQKERGINAIISSLLTHASTTKDVSIAHHQ